MLDVSRFLGFEWDEGNQTKNWSKHAVTQSECEEFFFNQPLLVLLDTAHSEQESRHFALGRTGKGRKLSVVFTARGTRIRVVSARAMSRAERRRYDQES